MPLLLARPHALNVGYRPNANRLTANRLTANR